MPSNKPVHSAVAAYRSFFPRWRSPVAGLCRRLLPLLLLVARADGQSVYIQDASFDNRYLSAGTWNYTLTPWQETSGPGNNNGFVENVSGFAADGANHLGLMLNHNVWQDLGTTYQGNTRYTLTVAAGNRSGQTQSSNQSRYLLADSSGTIYATGTFNASTLPVGTFGDAPSLVFATGPSSPAVGKTIRILLQAGGSGRSQFDRIRLTTTPLQPPTAMTGAATQVTQTGAKLAGTVNAQGLSTTVSFAYGTTTAYGKTVTASPSTVTGSTAKNVTATLTGLAPGTLYHYRVVATNSAGTSYGFDQTFSTVSPVTLSGLALSEGALSPAFAPEVMSYGAQVSQASESIRLTPATQSANATIRVAGVVVASGAQSDPVPLVPGDNPITVSVADGASSFVKNYTITVLRPPTSFVFDSPGDVAVTAGRFAAAGLSLELALNFAPATGTNLTVVNNLDATGFITGEFANLAHGQRVNLTHEGIVYPFVANYFGGTGNDLVLQWANMRPFAWGYGANGQLGNGMVANSGVPVAVVTAGALAGKAITGLAACGNHNLALASDGSLASWGYNFSGQLGDGSFSSLPAPTAVSPTGALAGKTVIAVAGGRSHSLALCRDGTVAAWGNNDYGQLGRSGSYSATPVPVDRTGVLAGKTVVAIAASENRSLALCSDGTLAAWGGGQLGNGTSNSSSVPVPVDRTGVLAGKTVAAIGTGYAHSLVLCSDGTLAAWGDNSDGLLGDGTTNQSLVPVLVNRTGVLAGRTVVAIAVGGSHSLALCADGTLAAWGSNSYGQLGNNTWTSSSLPVLVTRTGVLAGKTIASIAAGQSFSLAVCTDGTIASWGYNYSGQLGNDNTTNSSVPVAVARGGLGAGERVTSGNCGLSHALVMVAAPPPAAASSLAATGILDTAATLNGSVNANGGATSVVFEYGLTTGYGATVAAAPADLTGVADTAVSAALTGLRSGTTYHYRVVATGAGGTVKGADMTFTTSSFAALSSLAVDQGALWPAFASATNRYELVVPHAVEAIRFTPAAADPAATVRVEGAVVAAGAASEPLPLAVGSRTVAITVESADGRNAQTYTVTVIRRPEVFTFHAATDVPLTLAGFDASGSEVGFALDFAPPAGTDLTVVRITGRAPIGGAFANLAQGQLVKLAYDGVVYAFVANYYGGSGNDLVLQWANTRLASWGFNYSGQLGINTTTNSNVPVAVDASGVLAGKSIIAMSTGGDSSYSSGQSLVLCADGTVAAWGANSYGQLGNNTTTTSKVPVAVHRESALAGKLAVAAATGKYHHLVLCADGTLASWGGNSAGQLGVGGTSARSVPAAVDATGVLAGKRVAAIAAGGNFCLVLCADGTLASWGENNQGQLGNGTNTNSSLPVQVDRSGVLAGKEVVAIAAGDFHALALCADGEIAAWGHGLAGQMGTGAYNNSSVPVLVNRTGALAGKTVVEIAAGGAHNMVRCADGTLVSWGGNSSHQLGNGTVPFNGSESMSALPVPVLTTTGALAGKLVSRVIPAEAHNLAFASDGTLAGWGNLYNGRLGNGSSSGYTPTAVAVNTSLLKAGERFTTAVSSATSSHNLALVATPPAPDATTLAATAVNDTGATVNGRVSANNSAAAVFFEYGLTTGYGTKVAATPAAVSGTAPTAASLVVTGLLPGILYHYRMLVTSESGTAMGDDLTFTTTESATLTGLALNAGTLVPEFDKTRFAYDAMVPFGTGSLTVTPQGAAAGAVVRVNGSVVAAGAASPPIDLTVGSNTITTVVTGADGVSELAYGVTVTRLPENYVFESPTLVPVTANGVVLGGEDATISLNFAPSPGVRLMLLDNTGNMPIQGAFGNLAQGQIIDLTYGGGHYPFVVNYHGGTGNDLVLQWANHRLLSWGDNASGQLGTNSTMPSSVPTAVDQGGALAGKTILAAAAGGFRNLVLCADGTMFQWGKDTVGNLSTFNGAVSKVPVAVDQTGVLAGKRVTSIAVGDNHCLVLCADGTLAAWGNNNSGQLGSPAAVYAGSSTPLLVDQTGVLAGKTVVAIAAGAYHNLVLCADGTLAAWGGNSNGQLGDETTSNRGQPVAVNRTGVLAGRTITAIAANGWHSVALCADGTLAAWGSNSSGQLGNNTFTNAAVPKLVDRTGVLAGKTITALTAGYYHNLALCSDGTLASWGAGWYGALGNGATANSAVPVLVNRTGVLAGRTVRAITAGEYHSAALCTDGRIASWGTNQSGELGDGTTNYATTPVLVNITIQGGGERFATPSCGGHHHLAMSAMPPPPAAATLAATAIGDTSVVLNGQVNAQGVTAAVTFEYGLTESYGQTLTATPATATGTSDTPVALNLTGLVSGATYHYRVVATSAGGVARGADMTFTTTTLARLADLSLSAGTLAPAFAPGTVSYLATVPHATASVTLTPQAELATTTVKVNGVSVASGAASGLLPLAVGTTPLTVATTAADGINTMAYTVAVTRLPETFHFSSATTVPLTVENFLAAGVSAVFELSYAPVPGTDLTVVNNTGALPIRGQFGNLNQGQAVAIAFGGITYVFVADYLGGTGNDLVLRWANTRPFAWGYNGNGEVGNNSTSHVLVPVPVSRSGVLADKVVTALSVGDGYKVAVCHDGTLAGWGTSSYNQAGFGLGQSPVPLPGVMNGALAGKVLSAVSAGSNFTLGLGVDGSLAAWGHNDTSGQLGNNSNYDPTVPVAVDRTGILKDRRVVMMEAGGGHSLALCDDGTLAAWGIGNSGELGNGTTTYSRVPVRVLPVGALGGKRVVALAAGGLGYSSGGHSMALCSDGTLAAWGNNYYGQLGNTTTTSSAVPVAPLTSGVLAGKSVAAIAAGRDHSLVLCTDGTLAAWGYNYYGQLGNNSTTNSSVPVAVVRTGALAGKTVTAIAANIDNSYALCSDGTLAAWGYNEQGQLGNNSTTSSSVPVLVNRSNLAAGERFVRVSGPAALVASPPQDLTPAIADGSSVIVPRHALAWSREPLAGGYRVFFGTSREAVANATEADPQFLGECTEPVWSGALPALEGDREYFWRVDTRFAVGARTGKVWSFRVSPVVIPGSVSHAVIKGMAAATLEIPVTSLAGPPQNWTAAGVSLPSWLAVVTASGATPDPLRLRFTPGTLAAGLYQATVRVTSGTATADLPVSFRVVAAGFSKLVAHPVRPVVYGINAFDGGEGFARVVEIDAATGAMLRSLPAGRNPTGVDLDPATERLYIANMVDWKHVGVEVIDVAAWTALPPLVLGQDTYHLEATPTGRLITEGGNQWGINELYDAATGTKLAGLGGVRVGGCEADPTGRFFYHSDSNSSGARIRKFDISGDTFVAAGESPVIAYGGANLILSGDGTRLFWQGYSLAADNLGVVANLKNEVVACNRTGDLAVSESALWWADSGTQAATLPFASAVAAVSANDGYLVRFNPTTSAIVATPLSSLADLPGPWPRPGLDLDGSPQRLSWSPVADAVAYRVYLAASAAQLQAMTSPTATVTDHFYDVPEELAAGLNWFWRVNVVKVSGTTTGAVRSFGIRFASGPEVPRISPSLPTGADALAWSDRALLVGMGYSSACVLDFDPETGNTTPGRRFVDLQQGGSHVAMDGDRVLFGASGYSAAEGIESSGAVFTHRRQPDGTWWDDGRLTLANPVDGDLFGTGLAADGNLALAGTGRSGDYMDAQVGRVAAYITEPGPAEIQVFRPADGTNLDHFGHTIVVRGNHAVISATGGTEYNGPTGCLYSFNRSTTSGRWEQAQKISISGATAGSYPGEALAMSGNLLATTNGNGGVIVYTRGTNGVWSQSASIQQSSVAGSSTSFGSSLALAGDLLFVGDRDGACQGYNGGAVFVFRRSGSAWTPAPTIAPSTPVGQLPTYSSFGCAMAVRDGWLAVGGGQQREVWLFRVDPFANATPRFLPGIPTQCVIGRALSAPVRVEDANGNGGLTVEVLQKPSWLNLTDHGSGNATLGGTPAGTPGDNAIIQFRTRDADGGEAYYATQLTMLAPTDVPVMVTQPASSARTVESELVLTASVSGTGPFTWQWYRDDEPIDGATGPVLAIAEVNLADAGRYQVRVSNIVGETVSAEAVVTVGEATLAAGDWSTFGGSMAHSGRHPAALGTNGFAPAWSQSVMDGRMLNRAVVAGGRVFVTTNTSGSGNLWAPGLAVGMDLHSGESLWSVPVVSSYSVNPPSIHNGRLYFQRVNNSGGNELFCLDAQTGAQTWAAPFGAQWEAYEAPAVTDLGIFINGGTYGGIYGFNFDGTRRFFRTLDQIDGWTPTIHRGSVYSQVDGTLIEHDPNTGATIWGLPGQVGTAVLAMQGDSALAIAGESLSCVDLRTKSLRWKLTGGFTQRPAIGAGRAFGIRGNTVCSYALADGAPSTVYQGVENFIGQPVILNDRLIAAGQTKTLVFDLATGQVLQTLGAGGLLSYANGHLLVAGADGTLRAFRAMPLPRLALELAGAAIEPDGTAGFGAILAGGSVTRQFTVRNVGLADLSGIVLTVSGDGAADYGIGGTPLANLAPGASATFTLTFTPSVPGARPAVLRILSNDAERSPLDVHLTGRGNRAPEFAGYLASTPWQTPALIGLRKLAATATDADGDTVAVTTAGPVSANGGTVALLADAIRYTPPDGFSGADTFSVTLTDDGGASVTGTVTVQVGAGPSAGAVGNNPPILTVLPDGKMGLSFQGIPGRNYTVQRSAGGLNDWVTLATIVADSAGKVAFTDDNPPPGSAFYRLGLP